MIFIDRVPRAPAGTTERIGTLHERPSVVEDLEVNEANDGLIVYDPRTDRVHYLNSTAAVVFTLCDGEHDVAALAEFMAAAFELDEPPVVTVEECLAHLDQEGLLR
jgi:hypothetical protein